MARAFAEKSVEPFREYVQVKFESIRNDK